MSNWIPVDDLLPEEDKRVLLATKDGVQIGKWFTTWDMRVGFDIDGDVHWHGEVTHWQPLPKHPMEEK